MDKFSSKVMPKTWIYDLFMRNEKINKEGQHSWIGHVINVKMIINGI